MLLALKRPLDIIVVLNLKFIKNKQPCLYLKNLLNMCVYKGYCSLLRNKTSTRQREIST